MMDWKSTNYLRHHSCSTEQKWGYLGVVLTSELLQHRKNSSNLSEQSWMMRSEWQPHLLTFFHLPVFYNLIKNQ